MVRNPVQRAWSHMKKDLLNRSHMNTAERKLCDVSDDEIKAFMTSQYQLACGNYSNIISTWTDRVAPKNFYVGFFDDIHADPLAFLLQVFEFLGVRSGKNFVTERAGAKISATDQSGQTRPLPEEWSTFLNGIFGDDCKELERRFGRLLIH